MLRLFVSPIATQKIWIIGAVFGDKELKYMSQKIKDKIIYEENPWDDVKDFSEHDFKQVAGLLPSPSELKKAKIVVDGDEILLVRQF